MEQHLGNIQNYMMENNMQHVNNATAGCENVANVVGGVGENVGGVVGIGEDILGVKYDEQLQHEEHDVVDDNEWKYVKEVQQSEKHEQQQQSLKNFSFGEGLMADNETAKASYEFDNGGGDNNDHDGAFVFGGDNLLHQHTQDHYKDMFNLGNGHNTNGHQNLATNVDFETQTSSGLEEKNQFDKDLEDGYKAVGDFSSSFNMTEELEQFVPQVDVNIETKSEHPLEPQELGDEEEPSSLATNTTNGTSSLSENVPPAQETLHLEAGNAFDDFIATVENKENADPLTPQRPDELDIDQAQSQLNPDAKEFIPSFGSNPSSPTSPFPAGMISDSGEPMETQMYFGQQPSAVPRNLLVDDDFVAQSPRKGRVDNMDSIHLPKELSEFEEEADKRPHELETDDDEVLKNRDDVMTPDQQVVQQLPLDDLINEEHQIQDSSASAPDIPDFQPSFMDHGPETCVDPDIDLDLQPQSVLSSLQQEDDVMKRSMYVANNDEEIEDVLNSVQPIPTEIDSVNSSFIEESATESAAAAIAASNLVNDKELLQVEEKEHVSHSPSTEEMQMNLQNTLNSSNKDIPQIPIDMDNANQMLESMYMEQQEDQPQQQHFQDEAETQVPITEINDPTTEINDESVLADTTNPLIATDDSFLNNSFETHQQQEQFEHEVQESALHAVACPGLNAINSDDLAVNEQDASSDVLTPVSTTDEKPLLEETKEQQLFSISGLEQQMNEMILSNDGHISQADVVSPDSFADIKDENLEQQQKILVDESFINDFEQEEAIRTQDEKQLETTTGGFEPVNEFIESPIQTQQLENEMVAVEEPLFEMKQTAPLFKNEETEIVNEIQKQQEQEQEQEIVIGMVPETAPCVLLEQPSNIMDVEEEIVKNVATEMEELQKPMESEKPPMEVVEEAKPEEVKIDTIPDVEENKNVSLIAAAATATAAVAATTAAVGAKLSSSPAKKSDAAKKPLTKTTTATTAKPKVGATPAARKPLEAAAKKPIGLAAKPRVTPAKPATTTATAAADKKPLTKPSTTATATTRKPLSFGATAAPKLAVKTTTTTTTSTTRTLSARPTATTTTTSRPTTAPRTATTSTTTRKPLATATNGPTAKPRPATAPAKPTSLGLPATNGAAKTKVLSPRAAFTSQLRKTAPTTTSSTTTATKSPSKLASRTKTTTTSSASATHGTGLAATKPFTARPAPKYTASSSSTTTTTTTTRRLTVGGATANSTTTTTTTKSSTAPLRKSSPAKPLGGKTPIKTSTPNNGGIKSKTPLTKKESPPQQKPAPIRKPVDKTITNGDATAPTEHHQKQNGGSDVQQNGHSNIPMQNVNDDIQQPLKEQSEEQIPMDLINA